MTALDLPYIETGTQELLAQREGHVVVLTLNRPERLNAISGPMMRALSQQLAQANRDPEVRCLVLTGAGRGFCSGLDLQEQGARSGAGGGEAAPAQQLFDLRDSPPTVLWNMDKPVICALNGAAAGYGMDLALLCDMRVASPNGSLAAVTARRNLLPESGGTWLLPRLVGWARASEMFFRGQVVRGEEALAAGLVNAVVSEEELMPTALAWAQEVASNAPMAVQATKRMMRQGLNETYETTVDHLMMHLRGLMGMQDFREGVSAFLERRDPNFTGR